MKIIPSFPYDFLLTLIFVVLFFGTMLIIGFKGNKRENLLFALAAILIAFHIGIVDYWQKEINFIMSCTTDVKVIVEQMKILGARISNIDIIFLNALLFCNFMLILYLYLPKKGGNDGSSPTKDTKVS